jgi:hypothetical protein
MHTNAVANGTQPEVIRLEQAGQCRCGEPVAAGERVGYLSAQDQILCLWCLAHHEANQVDWGLEAVQPEDTPEPAAADGDLVADLDVAPAATMQAAQPASGDARHGRHSCGVAERANHLINRFLAARTLGTLDGEPRPIVTWTSEARKLG